MDDVSPKCVPLDSQNSIKNVPKEQNKTHVRAPQKNQQVQRGTNISLREDQVGITEYVSKHAGFKGIVKSRFSDFHVNEIDEFGQVLYLTDLTVPKPEDPKLDEQQLQAAIESSAGYMPTETWQQIESMAKETDEKKVLRIDVTEIDKLQRTSIHQTIKQLYAGKIISSTVNENEKRFLVIKSAKNNKDNHRSKWRYAGGDFVHFLVYKENMETTEVIYRLAKQLKMKPSQINFCGTKDKRAKTTQKCSIKRRSPSEIVNAAKQINNVKVGNFTFRNYSLRLGLLTGNRFRIALRHVEGDEKKILLALQNVREYGFINYFGLQRFGNNADVPTHMVGVALLKADYKQACELILKPRKNDIPFMADIRERWWKERNAAAALKMFAYNNNCIEKHILEGLAQYGENDYCGALKKVPRNTLLLYPHAFQSLIFNSIVSRRIKEFGLKLMPGDLIYSSSELPDELLHEEILATDEEMPLDEKDNSAENNKKATVNERKQIKILKQQDIDGGKHTIYDVVLPLPGYDIVYPENIVGTWYEELLLQYELSSEQLRHKLKSLSLFGTYRKILTRPKDMSWKFCKYDSPEDTLVASDIETLFDKKLPISNDNKYKGLLLHFNLPSACYATMILRELLKCDTSVTVQKKLESDAMKNAQVLETNKKRKLPPAAEQNNIKMKKK